MATVQALAQLIRGVSAGLMGFTPETWAAVHDTEQVQELTAAVDELKTTVAAMRDDSPRIATCLPAQVRDALRVYRRRLQFVAANVRFTDPGARELLTEVLSFDRWMGAHAQRCQACGGAR